MTLYDVVAIAGTVELLALLAVLVAPGIRGRRPTRPWLERWADSRSDADIRSRAPCVTRPPNEIVTPSRRRALARQ